jgi:hypothetical protein
VGAKNLSGRCEVANQAVDLQLNGSTRSGVVVMHG